MPFLLHIAFQRDISFARLSGCAAQAGFTDPDDGFIAVCKLFLVDGIRDVGMLPENRVSVMTVYDHAIPDDDGIDNFAIVDNVLLQLFQLLKSERRDLALKLRVNLKRIQIHHQTVPS